MVKRIARMGVLTALALILFVIEAQIPSPIPMPGVKLGLANIITVYAMFALGPLDTLLILVCRILLGSIFSGQIMGFFYSLAGGTLCYLVMLLLRKCFTPRQIWACSILGAIAHNLGQISVAVCVAGVRELWVYFPVLLLSGILTGLFTGLCAQFTVNRLKKPPEK